ncbi:MAG: FAD-dependent oxidoreductase [Polyangiaceae bacterium]
MGCKLDRWMPKTGIGTAARPLRVAIVGSGPSGFYAAEAIARAEGLDACVDMYERLPTPFGLVRAGVAPDHQKIKRVARIYEARAASDRFRLIANVTLGRDVLVSDLRRHYDAIIYAVGGERSRRIDVPGSDLAHSHPATVFVGWYNGHPDFRDATYDLSVRRAAVVGNGNVAIDVARILSRTPEELRVTDVAEHALDALRHSQIEEVVVLGRRGPLQAAFTPNELDELAELAGADVVVRPEDVALDPESLADYATAPSSARRNVERLRRFAERGEGHHRRKLRLRFLVSPEEVLADERGTVRGLRLRHNELVRAEDGALRPRPTDRTEELEVGLLIWAIGYRGAPIPGVPFDDAAGVVENDGGRVTDHGVIVPGEYVVGWARTGAQGLIGSHKAASAEIVKKMLDDLHEGQLPQKVLPPPRELDELLAERGVVVVRYRDWRFLDAIEQERGARRGAPRDKLTRVDDMLAKLAHTAATEGPRRTG